MIRFRDTCKVVPSALLALLALSGCTTHVPRTPAGRVVHLTGPRGAIPSAVRPIEARQPPLVLGHQIEPCIFRGSMGAGGPLYLQTAGGTPIAELRDYWPAQVDRLELPNTPGGRPKVVISFPIHMEGYLDENQEPLKLARRVDIVPGYIWLDRTTRVNASAPGAGTAKIQKKFPAWTSPPEFVTSIQCSDLAMYQQNESKPRPTGERVMLKASRLPLHESAGGREMAALQASDGDTVVWVSQLEKNADWLLVEDNEEFHFKGWIPASAVSTDREFGMIGLLKGPDITHQVIKPFPLRTEATDTAPVIAKAAIGAEILITPGPPGYRTIQFGIGISTSFFAREVDLGGAVKLAEGVEAGEPQPTESAETPETVANTPAPAAPLTPMPPPVPMLPLSIETSLDLAEVSVHASLEDGTRHIRKGDWAGARKSFTNALTRLSDNEFEAKIIGYALLGRACERKGDHACASKAHARVIDLATTLQPKIDAFIASHGDAAVPVVTRLLLAQGEALFYIAEQKRKAADAISFPIYRGSGTTDDVLAHLQTNVTDWVKKKRPLLEEVQQAYNKIFELEPVPPPPWVMLAASRSGDIWSTFAYEFQSLPPVPSAWNGTGTPEGSDLTYEEMRNKFRQWLMEGSDPHRKLAENKYKFCRDQAKQFNVAVAEGKRCEERLTAMGATP